MRIITGLVFMDSFSLTTNSNGDFCMDITNKKRIHLLSASFCDSAGTRTQGPYIKSVLLYQLSYEILRFLFGSAKIGGGYFTPKLFL